MELNQIERRALLIASVLLVLGVAVRIGAGPSEATWAWKPADGRAPEAAPPFRYREPVDEAAGRSRPARRFLTGRRVRRRQRRERRETIGTRLDRGPRQTTLTPISKMVTSTASTACVPFPWSAA